MKSCCCSLSMLGKRTKTITDWGTEVKSMQKRGARSSKEGALKFVIRVRGSGWLFGLQARRITESRVGRGTRWNEVEGRNEPNNL
jgi:hypothetical protein